MPKASPTRRIDEDAALRAVVEGTVAETGEQFYKALVAKLATILDTAGAWITEYDSRAERLRALAFLFGGQWMDGFEYPIAGTACETAIREKRLVHIPDRVLDLYTEARNTGFADVVSYLGMPILDQDERILGHLAVVDVRPMPQEKRLLSVFQLFATRVRAEMRRLSLEATLRAREERLTRLFDGAMDAIVELDGDLRVSMLNTAAQSLFQTSVDEVRDAPLAQLLGSQAAGDVASLTARLEERSGRQRHLWVPGPFKIEPHSGQDFLAEATLSRYEAGGKAFATLILRNVDERVQAQARIQSLSAQAAYLESELESDRGFDEIIGRSRVLSNVLTAVAQVAETDASVLISGETGTGKELIARAIHKRSRRRDGPLIKVNCAAIPVALIESEFFGHEKGAFTGATASREGRFSLADGGTIFLDEIGELPLELQGKLLRALQEGEFEPVGGSQTRRVDVRVVAATNRNLEQAAKDGSFRSDLFYRLSVFPLQLPPLRERGSDVCLIAQNLVGKLSQQMGMAPCQVTQSLSQLLQSYPWPGNVRELRNVIERALIRARGRQSLFESCLSECLAPNRPAPGNPIALAAPDTPGPIMTDQHLRAIERANMVAALDQTGWRVGGKRGAAALLGLSPSTLKSRMKSFAIARPA